MPFGLFDTEYCSLLRLFIINSWLLSALMTRTFLNFYLIFSLAVRKDILILLKGI